MQIMPSSFLRSALFSANNDVQEMCADKSKRPVIVADKKIATTSDVTMTLSGYELCQFDSRAYATCLNFYWERPLAQDSDDQVQTSFYCFAQEMGGHYGENPHIAIRASLLRLSFAQSVYAVNGSILNCQNCYRQHSKMVSRMKITKDRTEYCCKFQHPLRSCLVAAPGPRLMMLSRAPME